MKTTIVISRFELKNGPAYRESVIQKGTIPLNRKRDHVTKLLTKVCADIQEQQNRE